MKLWLLRHAQVQVPAGVCYGVSDVLAYEQATQEAAEAFAVFPQPGTVIWSSPLSRAWQLSQALHGRRADLSVPRADVRLCEMNFGIWEMQAWDAIARTAFDAWMADFTHHQFGGGESTHEVICRVGQALDDARALNAPEVVWVTHAGVIKAVQYLLATGGNESMIRPDQWPQNAPSYGGWMALEI